MQTSDTFRSDVEKGAALYDAKTLRFLFGATILGNAATHNAAARALLKLYNSRQIFGNAADTREALDDALATRFREHRVELRGSVALFVARGYRS